jgi:hypothetical protein
MLVYFGRLLFLQNTRTNFFATEIVDHFYGFFRVADPHLVFKDSEPVPAFSKCSDAGSWGSEC